MAISKVHPRVYVAGDPIFSDDLARDRALIKEHIDFIVDLREVDEVNDDGWSSKVSGKLAVHYPMYDDGRTPNEPQAFIDFMDVMEEAAEQLGRPSEDITVLVHCHMGVNRSPSMAMFLLMAYHECAPVDAIQKITEVRPAVGLVYAKQAVQAWHDLCEGDDEDFILVEFDHAWKAFDTPNQRRKTTMFINKCDKDRRSIMLRDRLGRVHAKAR